MCSLSSEITSFEPRTKEKFLRKKNIELISEHSLGCVLADLPPNQHQHAHCKNQPDRIMLKEKLRIIET